jgi:hypothetical protein
MWIRESVCGAFVGVGIFRQASRLGVRWDQLGRAAMAERKVTLLLFDEFCLGGLCFGRLVSGVEWVGG